LVWLLSSGKIVSMSAALEEITQKALQLSPQDKLALANRLLSDQSDDAAEIEAAWEEEILARIQAIDEGTALGVPFEEVVRAAQERRAK
jgi:hypothetical protein